MPWKVLTPFTRVFESVRNSQVDEEAHSDLEKIVGVADVPANPSLGLALAQSLQPILNLADYLEGAPRRPKAVHRSHREVQWGMLGNDRIGDCVPVMKLHSEMAFAADTGRPIPQYTDADAEHVYSEDADYVPGDPNTDNGTDMKRAMDNWRDIGIPQGKQIVGTLAVDFQNTAEVEAAIWEFLALQVAINLPTTAQGQGQWKVPPGGWDSSNGPGTWGGHGIPFLSYDGRNFVCITWAKDLIVSYDFAKQCVSQAFVVITEDMLDNNGVSPTGVNWDRLLADFRALPQTPAAALSSSVVAGRHHHRDDVLDQFNRRVDQVMADLSGLQASVATLKTLAAEVVAEVSSAPQSAVDAVKADVDGVVTELQAALPAPAPAPAPPAA